MRVLRFAAVLLLSFGMPAWAQAPKGVGGSTNGATVWVPDYYGQYVLIDSFDSAGNLTTTTIPVADKSCNPNALTVQSGLLLCRLQQRFRR